jgi:hypothetical protein
MSYYNYNQYQNYPLNNSPIIQVNYEQLLQQLNNEIDKYKE